MEIDTKLLPRLGDHVDILLADQKARARFQVVFVSSDSLSFNLKLVGVTRAKGEFKENNQTTEEPHEAPPELF